jgi:hypothetical protein
LGKKDLEAHAVTLLEKMGLEKGYLGFAMVMLGNGFWKEQFISIPFHKRILLLPHCLKHVEVKPAAPTTTSSGCIAKIAAPARSAISK